MTHPDYEEFIGELNAHEVRYLIVGAHAVGFHAHPRATKDLDVLVDPAPGNAARTLEAMSAFFGGADLGYDVADIAAPTMVIQLGVAPVRIDILTSLSGVPTFDSAWNNRVPGRYGHQEAHYLGLEDLIRAKEAAGRKQDQADLESLYRARDEQSG